MRLINYLIDLYEDTEIEICVKDTKILHKSLCDISLNEIRPYLFKNVRSYEVDSVYIIFNL